MCCEVFVFGYNVVEEFVVYDKFVAALFKCDAENLFALDGRGFVIRVDFDDSIITVLLGFQDVEGCICVAGRDNAIRNFTFND